MEPPDQEVDAARLYGASRGQTCTVLGSPAARSAFPLAGRRLHALKRSPLLSVARRFAVPLNPMKKVIQWIAVLGRYSGTCTRVLYSSTLYEYS